MKIFSVRHVCSVVIAALWVMLFATGPARAATLTIDDTLASDFVSINWSGWTVASVTGDCTLNAPSSSGSATCSEIAPMILGGVLRTPHPFGDREGVNFWEDFPGGTVSDTLEFHVLDPACAGGFTNCLVEFIFRSNVDGAPLTPLSVQGNSLNAVYDWLEADGPLVLTEDIFPSGVIINTFTIVSDPPEAVPVPEPTSAILLGAGVIVAGVRRWRKRQVSV